MPDSLLGQPFERKITLGNVLSMGTSLIAIVSLIVTVATYGANLRSDVDDVTEQLEAQQTQIRDMRNTSDARATANTHRNERITELLAGISADLVWMKGAIGDLQRIARREETIRR